MPLENYRDLSHLGNDVHAGFQFEFECSRCTRKWKSAFKPYRMGQFNGLLTRFAFLFSDRLHPGRMTRNLADMGGRGARKQALDAAMKHAETLYTECPTCVRPVCDDCWEPRQGCCNFCATVQRENTEREQAVQATEQARQSALNCPNCQTPGNGGRFCAECGFDRASTHKTCPGCGAQLSRQSRFCTDCGHGF